MSTINTHLGQAFPWICYKNGHNSFTITFTNNSAAYNISGYTFTVNIRKTGASVNALQLTQGSGINNGGATGILTIDLTQTQASTTLPGDYYFYEIVYVNSSKTYPLIQGSLELSAQGNPGDTTTSLSALVNLGGVSINATLTLVGGSGGGTAATTTFTPAGSISATDVQAAIQELDTEKQSALGFTPENVANKATDLSSNDNTHYPTTAAVQTAITSSSVGIASDEIELALTTSFLYLTQ